MSSDPAATHARILVLAGDHVFRATALAALQHAGHLADAFERGEEALEAARLGVFACGVLDLDLAAPDERALLRRLRATAPRLPLVVLTDRPGPEDAVWALRHGASEVVRKPVGAAGLCAVVRRAMAEGPRASAPPADEPPERVREAPARPPAFPAEAPPRSAAGEAPHEARRRVLVVDDDSLVGKGIRVILDEFEVVFAQSAAGALGRVASGRGFAAAVCDFRMPGMDGIQFHDELEKLDPGLARRIVYVTGWGDAPEFKAFLGRTSCACLPKPFDPDDLRRAVEWACHRDGP